MANEISPSAGLTGEAAPSSPMDTYGSNNILIAVKNGEPPAVFADPSIFGDQAPAVVERLKANIPRLGLGISITPYSQSVIVFNPKLVSEEQLFAADQKGTLGDIAQPIVTQAEADAEQPTPQAVPEGAGPASTLSAGSQTDLTAARVQNTLPQQPVKRALPTQGLLTNQLASRAI